MTRSSRITALLLVGALAAGGCTDPKSRAASSSGGGASRNSKVSAQASRSWMSAACSLPTDYIRRIRRGYTRGRGPDLQIVPRQPNYSGSFSSWSHSGPWPYLQDIPIVLYGPGFIRGQGEITLTREVTTADIAPTIAELTGVPMPEGRPGRPITEALVPTEDRQGVPRVVITIVWDGGGDNVLAKWPNAWPHLKGIVPQGTSIANATVGSSPSVTPAVHTNIGAGAFPRSHGIVDIPIRKDGRFPDAFDDMNPQNIRIDTYPDAYDQTTDNAALVGMFGERPWHLGMIGHGAYIEGGDRDMAVMFNEDTGAPRTNRDYFSLPRFLARELKLGEFVRPVDAEDGKIDGKWLGHKLDDPHAQQLSPVFLAYQSSALRLLLERESYGADDVTDLFFTNFKQIDIIGHSYNMVSREVESAIRYSDRALGELVTWLDSNVGTNRWVVILTADHGQTPKSEVSGGWPISLEEASADVARWLGREESDVVQNARPVGVWLTPWARRPQIARKIARFLTGYRLRQNVASGARVPGAFRDRLNSRLYAAAFPSREIGRVWDCATQ